jgi:signal transduction histidine kinase
MLVDRELRFVFANASYLRATSSRLTDLLGRPLLEVFPNDPSDAANASAARLRESLERVLATRQPDVLPLIPYRVPRPSDGAMEERFWSATHTPLLDEQGNVAFILQHTVDVTELHEQQQTGGPAPGTPSPLEASVLQRARLAEQTNLLLEAEQRHLRQLFEQAPGFMAFLRGPEHVFELANNSYYQVVGRRDIIGKPVREALPDVEGQGFFELLDSVYTSGQPFVGRALRVRVERRPEAEPEELLLDLVYQPIFDHQGTVSGIFVQGHDITEQKRLETALARLLERERAARADAEAARAEAERANRLKDEFLATLSHELRTPLNVLLGWSRLLGGHDVDDGLKKRAAEAIERNAMLQAQLVDDILDVSRIVAGKLRLRPRPVDLRDIVRAAIDIVTPAAEARSVRLDRGPAAAVPCVGDPERLQQVVWNLLTNAIKFTPPGGRVRIDTWQDGAAVRVRVRDNGIGIPPEFLPHVFERFRQADGGVARSHGGLGLGLSIVKHVVEAHGGEVEARSEGRGYGATFTVTLPVQPSTTGEESGLEPVSGPPSPHARPE